MKKAIFIFGMLFAATLVFGQSAADKALAQEATAELTGLYDLNKDQVTKMQVIQERRFRNYAQIVPLESRDYKLYLQKRKSIRMGTESSMKRMFTKEQTAILNQQISKKRKERSERFKELQAAGVGKEEIELALLELEG